MIAHTRRVVRGPPRLYHTQPYLLPLCLSLRSVVCLSCGLSTHHSRTGYLGVGSRSLTPERAELASCLVLVCSSRLTGIGCASKRGRAVDRRRSATTHTSRRHEPGALSSPMHRQDTHAVTGREGTRKPSGPAVRRSDVPRSRRPSAERRRPSQACTRASGTCTSRHARCHAHPRRASALYNCVWLMMGTLRPETSVASELAGTSLRGCTLLGTKLQHSSR